jgi:transposase
LGRNSLSQSRQSASEENRNVLRCANSACRANFWNRDVNAARNILELLATRLTGLGRIAAFARG